MSGTQARNTVALINGAARRRDGWERGLGRGSEVHRRGDGSGGRGVLRRDGRWGSNPSAPVARQASRPSQGAGAAPAGCRAPCLMLLTSHTRDAHTSVRSSANTADLGEYNTVIQNTVLTESGQWRLRHTELLTDADATIYHGPRRDVQVHVDAVTCAGRREP